MVQCGQCGPLPPLENLPVRLCPSVFLFVSLYYAFLFFSPHVPPAHLSIRLLDLLPVPHCSTISLSYRHSVFTLRLSVRTWQSICLLTRVCFSKLISTYSITLIVLFVDGKYDDFSINITIISDYIFVCVKIRK